MTGRGTAKLCRRFRSTAIALDKERGVAHEDVGHREGRVLMEDEGIKRCALQSRVAETTRSSDGEFMLYEDDGTSNAYKEGAFSVIPISFRENDMGYVFIFGQRYGSYKEMVSERRFNVRLHLPDRIEEFSVDYKGSNIIYNKVLN